MPAINARLARARFAAMGRSYRVTMANGDPRRMPPTVGAGHARDQR